MRTRYIVALGCCLLATACTEKSQIPSDATALPSQPQSLNNCPAPNAVGGMIEYVMAGGAERKATIAKWQQIAAAAANATGPGLAETRKQAIALIAFFVGKYDASLLIGGKSAATQARLIPLLNAILCTVGLPATFGANSLGDDGAVGFIYPTSGNTVVVTETQLAGLSVPAASVTAPTIVTVQLLPNSPGPLFTPLDQYPFFYEFHSSSGTPFIKDLTVGICLASNATPPDLTRLRVAHNVGTAAVITPLAPANFIDCTNAPSASAGSRMGDLAHAGTILWKGMEQLLLPQRLEARTLFGTGGVGGTVREFSPFGTVDTLGVMTANSPAEFHGLINGPADGIPSVRLVTPQGVPMAGIPVTFAITSGGGSLAGGVTVTDANGVATSGTWTLGPIKACTIAYATATMPAGSGLTGNPVKFFGCARLF